MLLPLLGAKKPRPAAWARAGSAVANSGTLYAEKNRVLRAIRDLDFDYDMDKLSDATYAAQRIY